MNKLRMTGASSKTYERLHLAKESRMCSSKPEDLGCREMTWQEHLKKCAREWQEMKKARKNAEQAKKKVPPKVPRRIRWKQSEAGRDLN